MKLSNDCIMVNNHFERTIFIYERKNHIKYEINEDMFELINDIHEHKISYNKAILIYDEEIIKDLISMKILTKSKEKFIPNIKLLDKINSARIFIEITDKCNLNCKHCYGGFASKNNNFIDIQTIDTIINEAIELGVYEFDITGGEPLLYPDLELLLSKLYDAGMLVSIFTNLTLLTNKHIEMFNKYCVKKIITSVDSCYEYIHDDFRGCNGCFNKTMNNLNKLKNTSIELSINTMIGNHNVDYIDELITFLKNLELPFVLDVITSEGRATALNENIKISSKIIKNIFEKYNNDINKNMNFKDCGVGDRFIYIKSNKNIYICPSLIDDKFKLGDVSEHFDLAKIWDNMNLKYGNLTCKHKRNSCNKCKGGCRARALKLHGDIMGIDDVYCTIIGSD